MTPAAPAGRASASPTASRQGDRRGRDAAASRRAARRVAAARKARLAAGHREQGERGGGRPPVGIGGRARRARRSRGRRRGRALMLPPPRGAAHRQRGGRGRGPSSPDRHGGWRCAPPATPPSARGARAARSPPAPPARPAGGGDRGPRRAPEVRAAWAAAAVRRAPGPAAASAAAGAGSGPGCVAGRRGGRREQPGERQHDRPERRSSGRPSADGIPTLAGVDRSRRYPRRTVRGQRRRGRPGGRRTHRGTAGRGRAGRRRGGSSVTVYSSCSDLLQRLGERCPRRRLAPRCRWTGPPSRSRPSEPIATGRELVGAGCSAARRRIAVASWPGPRVLTGGLRRRSAVQRTACACSSRCARAGLVAGRRRRTALPLDWLDRAAATRGILADATGGVRGAGLLARPRSPAADWLRRSRLPGGLDGRMALPVRRAACRT